MKKLLTIIAITIASTCAPAQEEKLSYSYAGTYAGKSVCKECDSMLTELELMYGTDTSGQFALRDKYMSKKGVSLMSRMKGDWIRVIDPRFGTMIILDNDLPEKTRYYLVLHDGNLAPLDANKQRMIAPIDLKLTKKF